MEQRLAVVVLAGGRSSRMGKDKALLELPGGETFLSRAIRMAESVVSAGNVYVSGEHPNCRSIPDIIPNCGPIGGIHAALHKCSGEYDRLLFTPVDMPCISEDMVSLLMQFSSHGSRFVESELPLALPVDSPTLGAVAAVITSSDRSIRHLYRLITVSCMGVSTENSWARNINTKADYMELIQNEH